MSNPWFRFYAAALRNPKVAALSDREFRLWVSLLVASSENDGVLPPAAELKHMLSTRLDHLLSGLDRLIRAGLIDPLERGYTPHHWDKFQYKSDTSTTRVREHRAKGNVSETPPDTEQKQRQKIEPIAQQTPPPREVPMLLDKLLAAAGLQISDLAPTSKLLRIGPITDLIAQRYSLELDVLPIIRELAAAGTTFQTWAYVVPIVIDRAAKRNSIPPKPQAPLEDWSARIAGWRQDAANWIHAWGPRPDERGCRAPAELLTRAA